MIINPQEPRGWAHGVRAAMETPKPAFCFYGNGPEARGRRGNVDWFKSGASCCGSKVLSGVFLQLSCLCFLRRYQLSGALLLFTYDIVLATFWVCASSDSWLWVWLLPTWSFMSSSFSFPADVREECLAFRFDSWLLKLGPFCNELWTGAGDTLPETGGCDSGR